MANVTIPNLPEQTGITDNDVLAIVDSGETTTSKIKVSTLINKEYQPYKITGGTGGNVYVHDDYGYTGNNGIADLTDYSALLAGRNNNIGGGSSYSFIGGGQDSDIGNSSEFSVVVGGNNNRIGGSAAYSTIVGGNGNTVNGTLSTSLGGQDANVSGSYSYNGSYLSDASGAFCGVFGGNGGGASGTRAVKIGGRNGTASGSYAGLFAGQNINVGGQSAVGLGGENHTVNGTFAAVAGGYGCINAADYAFIGGSLTSDTNAANEYCGTLASKDSDINNDYVVMLGCSGRTSSNDKYTYVESLEAFTHIVLNDYANLNFTSDANAATGGVPLGGIYHNSGDLKVRIT